MLKLNLHELELQLEQLRLKVGHAMGASSSRFTHDRSVTALLGWNGEVMIVWLEDLRQYRVDEGASNRMQSRCTDEIGTEMSRHVRRMVKPIAKVVEERDSTQRKSKRKGEAREGPTMGKIGGRRVAREEAQKGSRRRKFRSTDPPHAQLLVVDLILRCLIVAASEASVVGADNSASLAGVICAAFSLALCS